MINFLHFYGLNVFLKKVGLSFCISDHDDSKQTFPWLLFPATTATLIIKDTVNILCIPTLHPEPVTLTPSNTLFKFCRQTLQPCSPTLYSNENLGHSNSNTKKANNTDEAAYA